MKKSKKTAKQNNLGIDIIKIGTVVTDRATGLAGAITHVLITMERTIRYHVQPRDISLVTQHPCAGVWISEQRMTPGELPKERIELPLDVLGTFVQDTVVSCMRGMVVGIKLHLRGCVHVLIQPSGLTMNGEAMATYECDYRGLKNVPAHTVSAASPSPMQVSAVPSIC